MMWSCGFQLRVRTGPNRGNTYVIDAPVLKLGRAIRPGERVPGWVRINDDTVSRLHCELFWQDDRQCFRLLHRSTTNSTYVNGEVVEDAEVFEGDLIELGGTTLEVQRADLRWSKAASESINEWAEQPEAVPLPLDLDTKPMRRIPGATVEPPAPSNRRLAVGPQAEYVLQAEDGTEYLLDTSMVRVGGPTDPSPEPDNEEAPRKPHFTTEHIIEGRHLSFYNLILKYDEIVQNFKVARVGPQAQPVRLFRRQSGLIWQTELPEAFEIPLLEEDRILLGDLNLAYRKKGHAKP